MPDRPDHPGGARREVPERVVAAVRRLAPAATFLAGVCLVLAIVGAVGAFVLWWSVANDLVRDWAAGTVVAFVILAVLLVAPWWLRHAAQTLRSVADVPDRLSAISGTAERPAFAVASRDDVRALRRGGLRHAVRTIRTTVAEYRDFVSPWSAVVEVSAPPFWIWTGAAAVAALVTTAIAPVAALVALLL